MSAFEVNDSARRQHEQGLRSEREGEFAKAHTAFESAQAILADLPDSPDVVIQRARIQRDDGFTFVRSAIARREVDDLGAGEKQLDESIAKTLLMIIRSKNTYPGKELPLKLGRGQWRELLSEHGATVGLAARLATVKEVIFDQPHSSPPSEVYSAASSILLKGGNGYYMVSNAMSAARQARIDSRVVEMSEWIGIASISVALSPLLDINNAAAASRTFASRLSYLKTKNVAIESVSKKP